ncbi:MAG: serine--tRNA ligase [Rickettsiales bacterium]|jgi:seryl-tRNA synthetase|nr:serine--tRNA ligase [Rickettsiales bacterium]
MIDINIIRTNPDSVKQNAINKGYRVDTDAILKMDERVRALKCETENMVARKNELSRQVAAAADKAPLVAESKNLNEKINSLQAELDATESELNNLLLSVPQIADANSPIGKDDSGNVVVRTIGTPKKFAFTPRPHWEILDMNNWWASEKISEISGARTYTLMGEIAELDLAIQTHAIKKMIAAGFTYISVPAIVKPQMIFDAGHFPGKDISIMDNDVFYLNAPDKALAGTAEIVLNSMHRGEILSEDKLPIKYAGYSPCFRKEAGAAGKDTRGLVRAHQFHKVEQFIFCKPEDSEKMHAELLGFLGGIMEDLEMPYHILSTCTGDMGFNKIKMDDVEAWFPSQEKYRELGSCSTIGEFQARRTNTRFRENATGKVRFCATLNNTAIALPRSLAAVIENHQNEDGSVNVPVKLQSLMDGRKTIGKK